MRSKKLLVLLVVIPILWGCATFDKNSYKTLASAKVTYTQTMSALSDLQKQGKMSNDQAKKIVDVANVFYLSYLTAEGAYEVYHNNPTPTTEQNLTNLLNDVAAKLSQLLGIYAQYTGGAK